MSDHESDSTFDAQLRDVSLPEGFMERLRAQGERKLAEWTDDLLDAELRDVSMPASLAERLRQIPDDDAQNELLNDVPLPWGLLARLKLIPTERRRRYMSRLAVAASLFLMLSGAYLAALGGLFASLRPEPQNENAVIEFIYDGPFELRTPPSEATGEITIVLDEPNQVEEQPDVELYVSLMDDTPYDWGPASELAADLGNGLDLWEDVFLLRYGPIGAPDRAEDSLPLLEVPPLPPRGGIQAPLLRQYNRRFLLRHGVHPPVFPNQHASLQATRVPLSTDTTSYALTKRLLAEDRLPDPSAIHVEDFLAAMNVFPRLPQPGGVELSVAAGPSPFGQQLGAAVRNELNWQPGPASLVHVCAQAGVARWADRPPTHMTVVLDISASMRWADRLESSKQALRQLSEHLGPDDRLSLVVFNEQVVHRVENVSRGQTEPLRSILDRLEADGGTNLAGALQQGLDVALGGVQESDEVRHLILITDGQARLTELARQQLNEMLSMAADHELKLTVCEMNEAGAEDPVLAEIARAARGDVQRALSESSLSWSLVELLAGDSSHVVKDAVLTVTFRPQVVAAYRLFGHEATSVAGLMPVAVESDLRAGQSAGALYEIWLRPGTDDKVGRATLEWFDPVAGVPRRETRPISRLQVAPSFAEASLSLQAATIAAETAEILRESPFVDTRTGQLGGALDLADQASHVLAKKRSFQRFLAFLEEAREVRQRHGGD